MTNIKNTIIKINIVIFLISRFNKAFWFYKFGLVPALFVKKFFFWQILTYSFLHANFYHLLLNMLMLHILGKDLLPVLGKKLFLHYYLVSAMGSGLLIVLFSFFSNTTFIIPTIGASGAIFALLLAYGLTFKHRIMYIWGIYPIKAFNLVIILIIVELILLPTNSGISHIGHLSGALVGYLYIKYLKYKRNKEKEAYHKSWDA